MCSTNSSNLIAFSAVGTSGATSSTAGTASTVILG